MNEEEIFNILLNEYFGKEDYRNKYCLAFNEDTLNKAILGLIELYKQEKKENVELRKRVNFLSKISGLLSSDTVIE